MNVTEQSTKTNSLSDVDTQQLAGFWIRCGAFTIDFLLAVLIVSIIGELLPSDIVLTIIIILLFIVIHIFSPGKRIAGITVVSVNESPLTYSRRIERCVLGPALVVVLLGLLLSLHLHFFLYRFGNDEAYTKPPVWLFFGSLVVGILFAPAALPRKRALHDYLTETCVVYIKKISWWRKMGVICAGLLLLMFGVMYISLGF